MRRPHRAPHRRTRRWVVGGAFPAALVLAAAIVWHSAYASFSDSTPSFPVTFTTGTVVLGDDDSGTTMFALSGLKPGAAATRCITVTSTGTVPALVRFYGASRTTSKSLSSNLTVAVQDGTGGSGGNCAGFVPSSTVYRGTLNALPTGFSTGVGDWATTGNSLGETRSYQITVSMPASASTGSQAGTAGIAFTWEAQSQGGAK
jgi:hypothetical protein